MSARSEVIVAGWMDFEPADRDTAMPHFAAVVAETRQEPGCLDYAFTPDPGLPGRVRVFEHWDSEESLRTHLALPHVLALREALAPLRRTGRSLLRHTLADSSPMSSTPTPAP